MSFWGKPGDEKKIPSQTASGAAPTTAPTTPSNTITPIIPTPTKADDERHGKVRSALGPGTIIQGKLSFDSTVSIDGKLTGEIFSSKTLLVGPSGLVDAHIDVASLIVKGTVKGVIKASEKIEICEGGQIIGDITTPSLIIQEGCVFSGNCAMNPDKDKKAAQNKSTSAKDEKASSGEEASKSAPGLH